MSTVRVSLPFPISVNALYMRTKGGVILSKVYRRWKNAAGWALKSQHPPQLRGPVNVRLDLVAPDRRKRDADNLVKCVLDLLVSHQVIEGDDSTIVRFAHPEWQDEGEPCTVTITAISPTESKQ